MEKEIRLKKSWLITDEANGILIQRMDEGSYLEAQDSYDCFEQCFQLKGTKPIYFLSDMRGVKGISKEARKVTAADAKDAKFYAVAALINSGVSKILGNFMIRLNKHPHPVKMFTDETEAIAWLKKQREAAGL